MSAHTPENDAPRLRTVEWCNGCNDYHPAGEHTRVTPSGEGAS